MSVCTTNDRLDRISCGGKYTGNAGHCVAKVPWSAHADGMAHVTFASDDASRICWEGGVLRDPATVTDQHGSPRLEQDSRGYWRRRRALVIDPNSASGAADGSSYTTVPPSGQTRALAGLRGVVRG